MASKLLRGPGFRRERRILKRAARSIGVPAINIYQDAPVKPTDEKIKSVIGDDSFPKVITAMATYSCHVCGATGDDPCVTKTGNKAKKNHTGRDTL